MTRDQMFQHVEALHQRVLKTMQAKNHDYAHGQDPFANFKASEFIGIDPRMGILMRIMDKIARLSTHINTGKLMVPGEGAIDAIADIQGYTGLLYAMEVERAEGGALYPGPEEFDLGERPQVYPTTATPTFEPPITTGTPPFEYVTVTLSQNGDVTEE